MGEGQNPSFHFEKGGVRLVDPVLLQFVKNLLGFCDDDVSDAVLTPLILSAEEFLQKAGLKKPKEQDDQKLSLYNTAVAIRVKILHDGDSKGNLSSVLTGIVAQARSGDC